MKNIKHDRDQKEENVRDEIDNFLDDIEEEDTDVEIEMKEFQKDIAKLKCKKCNSSNMVIIKKMNYLLVISLIFINVKFVEKCYN